VANRLQVAGKKLAETMCDNGKGTGTMERACVVGGQARPASKIFSRAGDDLIVQLVDACNGGKIRWTKIALDSTRCSTIYSEIVPTGRFPN
jgi:hypothetical protein